MTDEKRHVAILVTGDRHAQKREQPTTAWTLAIAGAITELWEWDVDGMMLIHGAAPGIDTLAAEVFAWYLPDSAIEAFPADWDRHGRAAGPRRNTEMLERVISLRAKGWDVRVLAFHDDLQASRGTRDMVSQALAAELHVQLITSRGTPGRMVL